MPNSKQNWEEEFDRCADYVEIQISPLWKEWFGRYQQSVKSFIRQQIEKAEKQSRNSLLEELEGKVKEMEFIENPEHHYSDPLKDFRGDQPDSECLKYCDKAYNYAFKRILTLINSYKQK